jgi:hypothetical protein
VLIDTIAQLVIILLIFIVESARVNSNLGFLAYRSSIFQWTTYGVGRTSPFLPLFFSGDIAIFQLEKFAKI